MLVKHETRLATAAIEAVCLARHAAGGALEAVAPAAHKVLTRTPGHALALAQMRPLLQTPHTIVCHARIAFAACDVTVAALFRCRVIVGARLARSGRREAAVERERRTVAAF